MTSRLEWSDETRRSETAAVDEPRGSSGEAKGTDAADALTQATALR